MPAHGRSPTSRTSSSIATWSRSSATACATRGRPGLTLARIQQARRSPVEYDGLYATPAYTATMFVAALFEDLGRQVPPR